jgi:hypothetical protein
VKLMSIGEKLKKLRGGKKSKDVA